MALAAWAVPQLEKLVPLDQDSLNQIVSYTATLPRPAAAEHLRNLLGDSPQALEFISSFQSRRPAAPDDTTNLRSSGPSRDVSDSEVPRPSARSRKVKQPFNKLPPPRQVTDQGDLPGAYIKKAQDDYITSSQTHTRTSKGSSLGNTLALQSQPEAVQLSNATSNASSSSPSRQATKLPPSAAGPLISDSLGNSRSSSPSTKSKALTKVNLTGGTSMRGASTALADLDRAIRSLEISTNPTLSTAAENAARRCNCMAQRHALLAAAPNCLSCGKIICAKEGLGPCTFCSTPLLSQSDIQAMLRALREERGKEKMEANNASHKRAEVAKTARPFSNPTPANGNSGTATPTEDQADAGLASAKAHRDKLLAFQSQNAKRTRIHDEAADFETPDAGTSQWASPQERALQLKRQQKVLREQEWNARPEYEKRQMVVSLDVDSKGKGRAVKKMVSVSRPEPAEVDGDDGGVEVDEQGHVQRTGKSTGNFSKNPLLGALIRPVFTPKEENGKEPQRERKSAWRRVQDDNDDNEEWILDGGAYGDRTDARVLTAEEPACG